MAKKKITAVMSVGPDPAIMQAKAKAQDPLMTTAGNPLVEDLAQVQQERIVHTNMEKLFQDARLRRCPRNGAVYAGFMSTRFGE